MKRKLRLPSMENPEPRHEFAGLANKIVVFYISANQFTALPCEQMLLNNL